MKPKNPVWNCFLVIEENGKKTAKCKDCGVQVSAKSERLQSHRLKCADLKVKPSRKRFLDMHNESLNVSCDELHTNELSQPPCKIAKIQSNVDTFFTSTDKQTKTQLDEQIARTFYACNVPFNVVNHPQFVCMVEMLRPGYHPPSRFDLAGSLLYKLHNKLTDEMKAEVQGKSVTLITDGWSDIHNTPVTADSIHTGEKAYFLSAQDTGSNKKTAEYCASMAEASLQQSLDLLNCQVKALVTDNEKKMEAMRKIIQEKNPEIVVYGCSSHWLNLLGQDITPSQISAQVVEINKYFRKI